MRKYRKINSCFFSSHLPVRRKVCIKKNKLSIVALLHFYFYLFFLIAVFNLSYVSAQLSTGNERRCSNAAGPLTKKEVIGQSAKHLNVRKATSCFSSDAIAFFFSSKVKREKKKGTQSKFRRKGNSVEKEHESVFESYVFLCMSLKRTMPTHQNRNFVTVRVSSH